MAEQEIVFTDLDVLNLNLLEAVPSTRPTGGIVPDFTAPGPDIPAFS